MVSPAYSGRESVPLDVLISTGAGDRACRVSVDADCWPAIGVPAEIGGFLELPRTEWETLARADRLVLILPAHGELYRMLLDGATGRFIARQL